MQARPAYSYRDDPAVPPFPDDKPIIIFDGYCAFCSGWVQFVLRHDVTGVYRLLPAQSVLGKALYVHYGQNHMDYETNMLVAGGKAWLKSDGTIRMAQGLGFPWNMAVVLRIIPEQIRDRIYSWVARNRLKWFGERKSCFAPTGEFRHRFLG
jgi:predicted DCC family thiol-disulfide oxidoreductase YuxK